MKKQEITQALTDRHAAFSKYINDLPDAAYMYDFQGKWTAGQQLAHIVLCVQPLVQVYGMNKETIAQMFGHSEHAHRSYAQLETAYLEKLAEGGKAPTPYLPEPVALEDRPLLTAKLEKLIGQLNGHIHTFREEELETLLIPHPLLGKITLKEMLYNAMYHVQHHQRQSEQHLSKG